MKIIKVLCIIILCLFLLFPTLPKSDFIDMIKSLAIVGGIAGATCLMTKVYNWLTTHFKNKQS